MDRLSEGPCFGRGFEPVPDFQFPAIPAEPGLQDGSSWPGLRLDGSESGLSSQDARLPLAHADLLKSILRLPSVPEAQLVRTLQSPTQASLPGRRSPSSLVSHACWPGTVHPDLLHPQHSLHKAFCGGPLATGNLSSPGLPQLPFRPIQQAAKCTCGVAGTMSTDGGFLESLADIPSQPPLPKRSRTGEAGEFSLLLDASRHSRVPQPQTLSPQLPSTEQLVPQPCTTQHGSPSFSPPSLPDRQPARSPALRPDPSPAPTFGPRPAATQPAAAPTQLAAAPGDQAEANSDARLLAGLNEAMAGLPPWLCSSMRDSLYRISALSEVQGSQQTPQALEGVDALVGRLLYGRPGRCSGPGSPPRGPVSTAADSPQVAPAKDGLPEAEVDKLLNQAWASSPVPECSLPGKCSSLEAVQRQEAQWQNEDFFACVPVCPASMLQPETPAPQGSLDLDWLEPSASMLLGDL